MATKCGSYAGRYNPYLSGNASYFPVHMFDDDTEIEGL